MDGRDVDPNTSAAALGLRVFVDLNQYPTFAPPTAGGGDQQPVWLVTERREEFIQVVGEPAAAAATQVYQRQREIPPAVEARHLRRLGRPV